MDEKEKAKIFDTIRILMQLDRQSLLLIESGAKLLMARQEMDNPEKELTFRNRVPSE